MLLTLPSFYVSFAPFLRRLYRCVIMNPIDADALARALTIRPSCFYPMGQGYTRPDVGELRRFRAWTGYGNEGLGKLFGARFRNYVNPNPRTGEAKAIEYALWRLMLLRFGVVQDAILPPQEKG